MNIKKTANLLLNFAIKRLAEIFGIIIFFSGLMLLVSLLTYSPDDPNFIFPDNTQIDNILGFQGSYISDLFFQSIGLISFLIPITLLFTGVSLFRRKQISLIIENIFYVVLYSLGGALFFSHFYPDAFTLYINGNGGFVGGYFNQTFLNDVIKSNSIISYYFFIILITTLFLLSVNFNLKNFYLFLKNIFFNKNEKNYTYKNEIIEEYIPQEQIKNLIQEDLPFIKAESNLKSSNTFKLPSLDLLKIPSKKERENFSKNENNDSSFLEKILLTIGLKNFKGSVL